MASYYPPPAFCFKVEFGLDGVQNSNSSFQEVSGLETQPDFKEAREGGENRFIHRLPSAAKNTNAVLKRGIISDPAIIAWIKDVFYNDMSKPIKPVNITITLQNEKNEPAAKWKLSDAWPAKMEVGALTGNKNEMVIESIEFAYNTISRENV